MAKRRYSLRGARKYDTKGFISCKCKTPYAKSSIERTSIGTTKKLLKMTTKKYGAGVHAHNYKVDKGTTLSIGTYLNECKCSLFSGKARTSGIRPNRKDSSYVRTRTIKGINHVRVEFK
jgi:hypothetical protein